MYNKNGFTLLELLIAAALIGVLAMFATQAYRASASDIRIEDAKARALLLVNAAQRYYIEYPNATSFVTGSENTIQPFGAPSTCNTRGSGSNSVQQLVNCGFLEYRQVAFEGKTTKEGEPTTFSGSVDMWFASASSEEVEVCFKGKGRRVTTQTIYCTTGSGFTETSAS